MAIFKTGDAVQVIPGAVYVNNNKEIPDDVLHIKLYVREVKNDVCTVARAKRGPLLGDIAIENLKPVEGNIEVIEPYCVQSRNINIPLFNSANKNSGIVRRLDQFELLTIVDEKNGFGKIKIGAGWVELAKVHKLV